MTYTRYIVLQWTGSWTAPMPYTNIDFGPHVLESAAQKEVDSFVNRVRKYDSRDEFVARFIIVAISVPGDPS